MRNRWVAGAGLAAATLLTVTGCSSSFFEPMVDPVGTWTLAPDGGSTIVVRADHTFTAKDVPRSVACAHQQPENYSGPCTSDPVGSTGTWRLRENNPIEIVFDGGDLLSMSGVRSGKTIGFWVGDRERPDPTYEYIHD